MTKRYPLSEFHPPYIPDQDRQELPNSVVLDFKDGSTLQCACEHLQGQAGVLKGMFKAIDTPSRPVLTSTPYSPPAGAVYIPIAVISSPYTPLLFLFYRDVLFKKLASSICGSEQPVSGLIVLKILSVFDRIMDMEKRRSVACLLG